MTVAQSIGTLKQVGGGAWLFPGKRELELVVNCNQSSPELALHNLKIARGLEYLRDLSQIAELRLLSAECAGALRRCKAEARAPAE